VGERSAGRTRPGTRDAGGGRRHGTASDRQREAVADLREAVDDLASEIDAEATLDRQTDTDTTLDR
jgi:hypothetical protein